MSRAYAKYSDSSWSSIVVPAKTPQAIIEKIGADIAAVGQGSGLSRQAGGAGRGVPQRDAGRGAAFLVKEDKLWGPLVKASGVKPEN